MAGIILSHARFINVLSLTRGRAADRTVNDNTSSVIVSHTVTMAMGNENS